MSIRPPSAKGGGGTPTVKKVTANLLRMLAPTVLTGSMSSGLYDGNRDHSAYVGMGAGTVVVTLDFGAEVALTTVNWVLYWADNRLYHGVRLEASHDNVTWTDLRAAADLQPSLYGAAGLDIPVNASYRYLRFTSTGSTTNGNNEWVEITVGGTIVVDVTFA